MPTKIVLWVVGIALILLPFAEEAGTRFSQVQRLLDFVSASGPTGKAVVDGIASPAGTILAILAAALCVYKAVTLAKPPEPVIGFEGASVRRATIRGHVLITGLTLEGAVRFPKAPIDAWFGELRFANTGTEDANNVAGHMTFWNARNGGMSR